MKDVTNPPSLRALFHGPRGGLLAALLLTEFAAGVSGLSYAAVLPVAAAELDGVALYGPAVTISGVVGIAVMPAGAYLYGRLGPQAQLWLSTAVFLLGVTTTVMAVSMTMLIAGLAIRGLAAGLLAGLGLGVLSGLYEDPKDRERAFGLFALMWVVPSLIGPLVNSAILLSVGWRPAMAWPAILLLIGRALVSRSLRRAVLDRPDAPPVLSGMPWFLVIATGLVVAQVTIVVGSPLVLAIALVAVTGVLMGAFQKAVASTTPARPRAQSGGWALALTCAGYFGIGAIVPLIAVVIIDPSGVLAAVLVALGPLAWALLSAGGVGPRLSTTSARIIAAAGFPVAAGLAAAGALRAEEGAWGAMLLGAAVLVAGAAMGVIYPKIMTLAFVGFREGSGITRAHGGVVLSLSEDVGTAVGATVLAGLGGVLVTIGAEAVALLLGAVALGLGALWAMSSRGALWEADGAPGEAAAGDRTQ